MSTIFTLATPMQVGLTDDRIVRALVISSIWFSNTPQLGAAGTGELEITLTETTNGYQTTITYGDASVIEFFNQAAPAAGATVQDVMSGLLFNKLIADGKLPPGTLTTTSTTPAQ
jgi:hypothetical protein